MDSSSWPLIISAGVSLVQLNCVCNMRNWSRSTCLCLPGSWRSAQRLPCVTTLWWLCVICVFDTPTLWITTSPTSLHVCGTMKPSSGSRLLSCWPTCSRWEMFRTFFTTDWFHMRSLHPYQHYHFEFERDFCCHASWVNLKYKQQKLKLEDE